MTETISQIDRQRQLILAGLDDFTPNGTLPNFCGGQFGDSVGNWRTAVIEFLCENVECGLIELVAFSAIAKNNSSDWLRKILKDGYEERSMDVEIVWNALFFTGSEKLVAILSKFGMCDWNHLNSPVNSELAAELDAMCSDIRAEVVNRRKTSE